MAPFSFLNFVLAVTVFVFLLLDCLVPLPRLRKYPRLHVRDVVQFFSLPIFLPAQKVLKINKNLIEKKRGECVDFRAEHYFALNSSSTFVWKKQHTSTMVENDRISISGNRRTLRITHLTEADTALYSSEVLTTGGLEVTQYWLVVRGGWWSALYILFHHATLLPFKEKPGVATPLGWTIIFLRGERGWKILK